MKPSVKNEALWKRVLFTAVPLLLLLFFFARWLLTHTPDSPLAIFAAAGLAFLFALCGIRFIPQWMDAWSVKPWQPIRPMEGKRSGRPGRLHPVLSILLCLILFRVAIFVLAYLVLLLRDGYAGGIFDTLEIWNALGSDSRHYLNIAENWYVSSGDDRLLIVFMPLYPIMVRIVHYIFQNYLASGLFVSNLCAVFAGYVFYELALLDMDLYGARRSLKYLCILPASFLLSAPLSDSLFLLLSVSFLYLIRTDHYAPAGILGFFAAFTRMPGLLLFAPGCFELIGKCIREFPDEGYTLRWRMHLLGKILSLLLLPLGFLLYLYINYAVTGNATMFLTYQSAHWHQNLGWFFSSAATQVSSLLSAVAGGDTPMALGLWLPNLVYLFASLGIVTAGQTKLRASYVAYFLLYFAVCMGATWLLSAPRYLTCCFPLALSMGALTEKKWADTMATVVCIGLFLLYLAAFVNQWYVY